MTRTGVIVRAPLNRVQRFEELGWEGGSELDPPSSPPQTVFPGSTDIVATPLPTMGLPCRTRKFVRAMDSRYIERRFSCLLQRRLNSRIPLVCQRNALCVCVHSLVPLSVHYMPRTVLLAPSVRVLRMCQRLTDPKKYQNSRNCHQT